MAFQRGKVLLMEWKNKKDVSLLSTVHNPGMIEVQGRRDLKTVPWVVNDYNNTMGGVDRADRNLTPYGMAKNKGKKYDLKIFMHMVEQTMWNSYIL